MCPARRSPIPSSGGPDIGLVSMSEVAETIALIRDRVGAHLIVDADTGYGNALNVVRTVRAFERAGASAIQLEDQDFPKRCGHLDGKALIPADEMVGKIKAALDTRVSSDTLVIARTDAVAVEGFERAIERAALLPRGRRRHAVRRGAEDPRGARARRAGAARRAADGQHGGRRQDASPARRRARGARLRAGDLPRRHRARARPHGGRLLRLARRATARPSRSATRCSTSTGSTA